MVVLRSGTGGTASPLCDVVIKGPLNTSHKNFTQGHSCLTLEGGLLVIGQECKVCFFFFFFPII